jgi:hypothetical protein
MISKNEFIEDLTGDSDNENTHTSSPSEYTYESQAEEDLVVKEDDPEKDSLDGKEGSDAKFELEAEVVKGKGDY